MATITSTSTQADITAAYLDNCGYAEDGSAVMARKFATACRAMLMRGITVIQNGDNRAEMSPRDLRVLMNEASNYAAAHSGSAGRVRHRSFRNLRD